MNPLCVTVLAGNHKDDLTFANEMNQFYGRFGKLDCNNGQDLMRQQLGFNQEVTAELLKKINMRKASGPDEITGRY